MSKLATAVFLKEQLLRTRSMGTQFLHFVESGCAGTGNNTIEYIYWRHMQIFHNNNIKNNNLIFM